MALENDLVDHLNSVTTLTDVLTGGIYGFSELGLLGLTPENPICSAAFTLVHDMPVLNPSLVVRVRGAVPDYSRSDVDTQEMGDQSNLSLWFYQSGGYDDIHAAKLIAKQTLNMRSFSGMGLFRLVGRIEYQTMPEFDGASLERDDYICKRVLRT